MSMGTKSPLYRPIENSVVVFTANEYPRLAQHALPLYNILTDYCYVETLLWFATVDLLDRALVGQAEYLPGGELGPSILLSVVGKDWQSKYQSPELKLLHDVVVEMQMAGRNFKHLQEYLVANLNRKLVFMHSCSVCAPEPDEEEHWYKEVIAHQLLRTELDWSTEATIVPLNDLSKVGIYPPSQEAAVRRIFENAGAYTTLISSKSRSSIAA